MAIARGQRLGSETQVQQNSHANTTKVGIPLELDIGVIDVNTCEPLEDVLISLWVCPPTPH